MRPCVRRSRARSGARARATTRSRSSSAIACIRNTALPPQPLRACSGPRTRIWATTATRGRSTTKTSAPRTKGESSESGEYECDQWKSGDVIGLACDLDKMQMHVSLNGSSAAPTAPPTPLARASLRPFLARQARCASTSARRTSGTRRLPRTTSRRMPHWRVRPFSVPVSYSHTNTHITQLRLVNPLQCRGY